MVEQTRESIRYEGSRDPDDGHCFVEVVYTIRNAHGPEPREQTWRKPLPRRNEVMNHSPDGFEWGYSGSGPAQLALAILCDYFSDTRAPRRVEVEVAARAVRLHQKFKGAFIASLSRDARPRNAKGPDWWITGEAIADWLALEDPVVANTTALPPGPPPSALPTGNPVDVRHLAQAVGEVRDWLMLHAPRLDGEPDDTHVLRISELTIVLAQAGDVGAERAYDAAKELAALATFYLARGLA